jgi:hypothetical protein
MLFMHQLLLLGQLLQAGPYEMALAAGQLRLCCAVAALLLLCAAVPVEPSLTFEDVRRIALASSGSGSQAGNQRFATADGVAKAKALGIPINSAAIAEHPGLAQVARTNSITDESWHGIACHAALLHDDTAAAVP